MTTEYSLKSVTFAEVDNAAAIKLYKDLLVETILQRLKEDGKVR